MAEFFFHDADGRILMAGTCSARELALQKVDGATLREGVARPGEDYFDGAVRPLPKRPSPAHEFDYRAKAWRLDAERAWAMVRTERDKRLAASDWTTLSDVSMTPERRAEWFAYRQDLRDATKQPDPTSIIWPSTPK